MHAKRLARSFYRTGGGKRQAFHSRKTNGLTEEQLSSVISAVEKNKVKGEVISQYRFSQAVIALKQAVENGDLGKIILADIYMKYNEMSGGKTSIFISHRLASSRFCDRILFIKDGGIAEEGTHESLLAANGDYAELFHVQARYYQEGSDFDGEEN